MKKLPHQSSPRAFHDKDELLSMFPADRFQNKRNELLQVHAQPASHGQAWRGTMSQSLNGPFIKQTTEATRDAMEQAARPVEQDGATKHV